MSMLSILTCRTVFEEIGDGSEIMDVNGREVSVRAYCSWFNFKGGDQQKAVSVLSGGERNRLLLAKVRVHCVTVAMHGDALNSCLYANGLTF